jgi:hypothetical protein
LKSVLSSEEDIVQTLGPDTPENIKEQDEIAEYIFGIVAKRDGKEFDDTKSLAWQRGWASSPNRPLDLDDIAFQSFRKYSFGRVQ